MSRAVRAASVRARAVGLLLGTTGVIALLAGCGSDATGGIPNPVPLTPPTTAAAPTTAPTGPPTTENPAASNPAPDPGAASNGADSNGAGGNGTAGHGATSPSTGAGTQPAAGGSGGAGHGDAAVPRCVSGQLSVSVGPAEGAAGSTYRDLVFTSRADSACELTGFPGVSYVTGDDGTQVGAAAAMSGDRGGPVRLSPGGTARAQLRLVNPDNFDTGVCQPTPVRGLRVYPPGDTASLFVPLPGTGCAGQTPAAQLEVQTMRAG